MGTGMGAGSNKRELKYFEKDEQKVRYLEHRYNGLQADFVQVSKTMAEALRQLTGAFLPLLEVKEREC